MKSTKFYVKVRVEIDYDETQYSEEEAVQETISQCDYGFSYDCDNLMITGTEICDIDDKF